ncbi:efflux RND transporter periplasmic adaptor subunit [uncultured Paludibaculum sp.]|uniref:efflux RND transporter periplasmic adaptor subunit n=1 Tax=uncultured Paludibaculum sp. TaxID=1765020 RepID=UPI002AABA882|nr:efflux RND transporter periplasmic adaptor subunit [uncultured Paludibaculum sp.]
MTSRNISGRWAAITLAVLTVAVAGCNRGGAASKKDGSNKKGDAVPVTLTAVAKRDVPLDLEVIGNVEAYSVISVRSQVSGPLQRVHFREGDFVSKGQVLFSIDPSPFNSALREAEANVARAEAMLGQAQATLKRDIAQSKYAGQQADRYKSLQREGIVSKEQVDQFTTAADTNNEIIRVDEASIRSAEASLVASRAQVENARIQLGYTTIRSPIDGRTGNIAVKEGNIVSSNTIELTSINQIQPIYVTFSVPESNLAEVKRFAAEGRLPVSVMPSQGEETTPEVGTLTFVDNNVDATTGTIKLKGTFPNSGRHLWPGAFVRVSLRLSTQKDALIVPAQAIQEGQEGQFVYVATDKMTVEQRPVKVGSRSGQDMVIDHGVQAGEKVVVEGQLRLAPGMKVRAREPRPGGPGKGGKKRATPQADEEISQSSTPAALPSSDGSTTPGARKGRKGERKQP